MKWQKWRSRPIWEIEESHGMCLVSRNRDAFADELIHLAKEVGVRYSFIREQPAAGFADGYHRFYFSPIICPMILMKISQLLLGL